jgi:hypothetical protein
LRVSQSAKAGTVIIANSAMALAMEKVFILRFLYLSIF